MNVSIKEGKVQVDSDAKLEIKKQNGHLEIHGIGKSKTVRLTLSEKEQKALKKFLNNKNL